MSSVRLSWAGVGLFDDYTKWFRVDSDTAPERDIQVIDIPGRSGSLLIDNKKYPNVDMIYNVIFYPGPSSFMSVENRVAEMKRKLALFPGAYTKFRDTTDHSDEFYLARVTGELEPVFTPDRSMAKMRVTFNRKPQRFLRSGENVVTLTHRSETISNPGTQPSQPLLKIYGTGTVTINDQTITILTADEYTMVDCESMECYKGTVSKNGSVAFTNNEFPTFAVGSNSISLGTGISKVDITPRWWRL